MIHGTHPCGREHAESGYHKHSLTQEMYHDSESFLPGGQQDRVFLSPQQPRMPVQPRAARTLIPQPVSEPTVACPPPFGQAAQRIEETAPQSHHGPISPGDFYEALPREPPPARPGPMSGLETPPDKPPVAPGTSPSESVRRQGPPSPGPAADLASQQKGDSSAHTARICPRVLTPTLNAPNVTPENRPRQTDYIKVCRILCKIDALVPDSYTPAWVGGQ